MLLLLFLPSTPVTANNTYIYCSSTNPDVLQTYVDGTLVMGLTSGS